MKDPTPHPDLIRDHRRQWRDCLYVYPVIARRSKGLSIGVNLNLDMRCNFACAYCQVDRSLPRGLRDISLPVLRDELELAMAACDTGRIWKEDKFAELPRRLRRINDIAFSGDGEPTCMPEFDQAVRIAAEVKAKHGATGVKLVVITNATHLTSPQVTRALPILDDNNGEFWCKLDAGTEDYFERVNRPHPGLTLDTITHNIISVAQGRPVVIQTLLMRLDGQLPPAAEIEAYCARLRQILDAGGQIKLVQVHTIARTPAEQYVAGLTDVELDQYADAIRAAVSHARVECYYGVPLR